MNSITANKGPENATDVAVNLDRPLRLDAFLKIAGVAPTGGVAKLIIQSGDVRRNGAEETRRKAQLEDGDIIEVARFGVFRVSDESSGSEKHPCI